MLRRLQDSDVSIPIHKVHRDEVLILADRAAAVQRESKLDRDLASATREVNGEIHEGS